MRMNSWRNAALVGVIYPIATFVAYIAFTYFISFLTNGEPFITKDETLDMVAGIPFDYIRVGGVILSAIISMAILWYDDTEYFGLCISISFVFYIALCFADFISLAPYFEPLNTFDSIYYMTIIFPIGSGIGMIGSLVINEIVNWRRQKREIEE